MHQTKEGCKLIWALRKKRTQMLENWDGVASTELSLLASQDSDLQPPIFLSLTLQPSCLPSTVMYREQHHPTGPTLKYRRRYLNLYSLGCSRIGCNSRYIQSGFDLGYFLLTCWPRVAQAWQGGQEMKSQVVLYLCTCTVACTGPHSHTYIIHMHTIIVVFRKIR